jgi:hypothetical protein
MLTLGTGKFPTNGTRRNLPIYFFRIAASSVIPRSLSRARGRQSQGSSIASTTQQMAISFGVASASLVTVFFLPDRYRSNPQQFIHGIHRAFFVLGGMSILSTIVFHELKKGDGDAVSQGTELHAE